MVQILPGFFYALDGVTLRSWTIPQSIYLRKYKPHPVSSLLCLQIVVVCEMSGGGGEIRTHGRVTPTTIFKTVAFNRSATPPKRKILYQRAPIIRNLLEELANPATRAVFVSSPIPRQSLWLEIKKFLSVLCSMPKWWNLVDTHV